MDIEQYIASGVLEAYAAGRISDQERREVECMSSIYPEIKEALTLIEADAERFARAYAKKAPAGLREKMMAQVKATQRAETAAPTLRKVVDEREGDTSVRKDGIARVKDGNRLTFLWAAAAALLALFGLSQYFANRSFENQVEDLQLQVAEMQTQRDALQEAQVSFNETLAAINRPSMKKVILQPVNDAKADAIALFWDSTTGEVLINPGALPTLPEDNQYQLWVLIDGNPNDMGVLPLDGNELLLAGSTTQTGDAFAITIEPLGGNATPSLDQLVVLGNIT